LSIEFKILNQRKRIVKDKKMKAMKLIFAAVIIVVFLALIYSCVNQIETSMFIESVDKFIEVVE